VSEPFYYWCNTCKWELTTEDEQTGDEQSQVHLMWHQDCAEALFNSLDEEV
jgi:hypothetical protein